MTEVYEIVTSPTRLTNAVPGLALPGGSAGLLTGKRATYDASAYKILGCGCPIFRCVKKITHVCVKCRFRVCDKHSMSLVDTKTKKIQWYCLDCVNGGDL